MRKQPTGVDSIVLMFHVEAAGSSYFLQAIPMRGALDVYSLAYLDKLQIPFGKS